MLPYSVKVIWSDEDEAFLATVPEFPGLSAFGETQEEAVQEALVIAQDMVDIQEEDGEPVPEPLKKREYSGQFRIRLPQSLHAQLAVEAKEQGLSLNSYLIYLLTEKFTLQKVERLYRREFVRQQAFLMGQMRTETGDFIDLLSAESHFISGAGGNLIRYPSEQQTKRRTP